MQLANLRQHPKNSLLVFSFNNFIDSQLSEILYFEKTVKLASPVPKQHAAKLQCYGEPIRVQINIPRMTRGILGALQFRADSAVSEN